MKHSVPALLTTVFLFMSVAFISAQDRVCYTGTELSNHIVMTGNSLPPSESTTYNCYGPIATVLQLLTISGGLTTTSP